MLTFLHTDGLVYACGNPELRYTPAQKAVATFSVAANHKWTNEDGSKSEESCFIECTAWDKVAELISKYVSKGDPLYVEGDLRQDKWESKEGDKRSKHTLLVRRVVFIKPKE